MITSLLYQQYTREFIYALVSNYVGQNTATRLYMILTPEIFIDKPFMLPIEINLYLM